MKYLLDVNALIALKHSRSRHHQTCRTWVAKQGIDLMATCALTELGFIRVSMAAFGVSLADAQKDLADLKAKLGGFVEKNPAPKLPAWSTSAPKTTGVSVPLPGPSNLVDSARNRRLCPLRGVPVS